MKKAILILAISAVCLAAPGMSQTVVGTSHDMSSALPVTQRVCVFCHTPHQPEGPPQINTDPLWNHTLSAVGSYGVYGSTTLDAVPVDIGGLNTVSNLCMSCHDATVGLGSLYNDPNIGGGVEETPTNSGTVITGNANMGTNLSNDHPVNFLYDTALSVLDGGLVDPAGPGAPGDWLFGGFVQCASCHDPHDNTNPPFLIASNVQSAMCTTCHLK
jgi:predicted CXXCH cytochrome family protein